MARVVATPTAVADLRHLVVTHSLPADTSRRVARSAEPLARFPLLGARLGGRWGEQRFVIGPWPWLVIVYVYDEATDTVSITTVQDGRAAESPTASR